MNIPNQKVNLLPGILVLIGVVLLVFVGGLFAFQQEPDIIQGQADVTEYRVSSKVPGRVQRIYVEEGQPVSPGDTLVVLTAPDVTAKLEQARAARRAAGAQDRKALKGARQEQVRAAYEMWQKAVAGVTVAEKSYRRVKALYDQHVTTAQKLDEVTAQRDAARATERAARAQYDMARNGAEAEDKAAARAMVDRAQGAVDEVESYVAETYLIAPQAGEVSEIFPQEGELVGTGSPIMNIAKMQSMWVSFNVREDHLARFRMNGTVQATIPALNGRTVRLKVYHIKDMGSYAAWKATKTTGQYDLRTFEVKARPENPVPGLRPGMSVLMDAE